MAGIYREELVRRSEERASAGRLVAQGVERAEQVLPSGVPNPIYSDIESYALPSSTA
jgi:hypothetical protein